MILARDANPDETLYCVGGRAIKALLTLGARGTYVPAEDVAKFLSGQYDVSQVNCQLGLDWLYLAGVIEADDQGRVRLCS